MNNTRTLFGTLLLTVSSFALAAGHEGSHATGGSAHGASAASASEHGGARPSAAAGVMSSGPFKGFPVIHETIAGHEAFMAHLPAGRDLNADERREVRSAGFLELHDQQGTYYCRRIQTSLAGWVSECFRFDARTDSEEIQDRSKENQSKPNPKEQSQPQKTPGRVAYS
jgi:hypothetical protein